eukprot:671736-Pyramimonas_sp.AAC.1
MPCLSATPPSKTQERRPTMGRRSSTRDEEKWGRSSATPLGAALKRGSSAAHDGLAATAA